MADAMEKKLVVDWAVKLVDQMESMTADSMVLKMESRKVDSMVVRLVVH